MVTGGEAKRASLPRTPLIAQPFLGLFTRAHRCQQLSLVATPILVPGPLTSQCPAKELLPGLA